MLERLHLAAPGPRPIHLRARVPVRVVLCIAAVVCGVHDEAALAGDPQPTRREVLAAVAGDPMPSVPGTRRVRPAEDLWRLVQNAQSKASDAGQHQELALAAFPSSAPESLEEEVAKAHGLEIVRRTTISSLGLRLVRYRIPDARPLSAVVDRLKADQRVARAQANISYTLPEQQARPVETSRPGEPAAAPQTGGKDGKRPVSVASAAPEPKRKSGHRKAAERSAPATGIKQSSLRVGGVGDVLSGGL
jgi:hypothetical protein